MQPRRLDLNEVVSNMTMMLGRILGEDIVLQLNYWPQPVHVLADASMIEQVLLNLAVNARDAMPTGGQLAIRMTTATPTARQMFYHPEARGGSFICMSVSDSGCGIAPENLRRIFEPFFTTKEVGKGTGLGLATVYGIVKQHQGWIEVNSQPGAGTTFRVYFPTSDKAVDAPEKAARDDKVRGGHETILVVEDEPVLRELARMILKDYDYEVLEAATGHEALKVWEKHKGKIDLLLTDMVMPEGMSGRELAEKLRRQKPELKVIYTSGYSADVMGQENGVRDIKFLQKPYPPPELAQAVRECLDVR